jgi:hypothetical protein
MASSGRGEMAAITAGAHGVAGALAVFDAAPLPAGHLQQAVALQLVQRGAQRVAAHLQTGAQLALARQMPLPVACLHGLTQALRRLRHKGDTLGEPGGGGRGVTSSGLGNRPEA